MLFVAGTVTDLWVPSSVTVALLGVQLSGAVSSADCSSARSDVPADGHRRIMFEPERVMEGIDGNGYWF